MLFSPIPFPYLSLPLTAGGGAWSQRGAEGPRGLGGKGEDEGGVGEQRDRRLGAQRWTGREDPGGGQDGEEKGERRKGEGEVRGGPWSAREWFCSPVSCLQLAGPPVQELDPRPLPGGSRMGRARLPPALSQEGAGRVRERAQGRSQGTVVRGRARLSAGQTLQSRNLRVRVGPLLPSRALCLPVRARQRPECHNQLEACSQPQPRQCLRPQAQATGSTSDLLCSRASPSGCLQAHFLDPREGSHSPLSCLPRGALVANRCCPGACSGVHSAGKCPGSWGLQAEQRWRGSLGSRFPGSQEPWKGISHICCPCPAL